MGIGIQQDDEKAIYWYKRAATQGSVKAELALGMRYGSGIGVEQNMKEAVFWLKKAYEQGDPLGAQTIAQHYESGTGVPQSYAEAAKWYRRAADKGDGVSEWALGEFYEKGEGVAQNLEQAKKWYSAAAAQGFVGAKRDLDRLLAAQAKLPWEDLATTSDGEVVAIDVESIRRVDYPDISQPTSYAPLRYKMISYIEVWARGVDRGGDLSWRSLLLFDCNGSSATLAHADIKANKWTDVTSQARQAGAEAFMVRIAPDTLGEVIEARVCHKR